jgi:hypothetical protein
MKLFSKITIIFLVILLTSCTLAPIKEEKKPGTLKVGDTIPDFTTNHFITHEPVSFNNDIKGKSEVIALLFVTPNRPVSKDLIYLCGIIECSYEYAFRGYAINMDLDDNGLIIDNGMASYYSLHLMPLSDPDFTTQPIFGFNHTPSLALADGEGKIFYIKAGFTRDDGGEVMDIVKNALKK